MRVSTVTAIILVTLSISGCIYTQSDIDERDERIAELESRVEELESKLSETQTAAADLQSNVDRLQSENWRDVIPDIESSSNDLQAIQE